MKTATLPVYFQLRWLRLGNEARLSAAMLHDENWGHHRFLTAVGN